MNKPFTVPARYYPKSVAFTWSGTNGILAVDSGSFVFTDEANGQVTTIPFHDIQKAWFDFGQKEYLRIKKTDGKSCFFILMADGDTNARLEWYKVLEQTLSQNGLDTKNSLNKVAKVQKFLQRSDKVGRVIQLLVYIFAIAVLAAVFLKHR